MIVADNVALYAVAAAMTLGEVIGLIIAVAAVDGGQAQFVIVGSLVARSAKQADVVNVVDGGAVRDDRNARKTIGANVVFGGAGLASKRSGSAVGAVVCNTVRDFSQTSEGVSGQNEAVQAKLATVLVSEVNSAVRDEDQTRVTLGGKPREGVVAKNTKTHAIVLNAVGDGSGNARAPIPGLSETIRALGADVGSGDVAIAVGNSEKALVLGQHVAVRAGLANCGGSVGTIGETTDDVSHHSASLAIFQIVALVAVDATAAVVDGGAMGSA